MRNFSAITSETVTATWSFKGLVGSGNFNEIGVNLLGLKSNNQTKVLQLLIDVLDLCAAAFKPWYERAE